LLPQVRWIRDERIDLQVLAGLYQWIQDNGSRIARFLPTTLRGKDFRSLLPLFYLSRRAKFTERSQL
jgi:hypothetical protein